MIISWVEREFLLHGILYGVCTPKISLQTCHVEMIPLARVRRIADELTMELVNLENERDLPTHTRSLVPLYWYRPSLFPLGSR